MPVLVSGGFVGNSYVLFFFSILSNQKSFYIHKPFIKGQFLTSKLNHLSSPKYFLAKEFPACYSFIERVLKAIAC